MAATKLIAMHQNKGLTQGETFEARCKYVENPDKTEDGKLITAYACESKSVASEFALMKRNYDVYIGKEIPGILLPIRSGSHLSLEKSHRKRQTESVMKQQ